MPGGHPHTNWLPRLQQNEDIQSKMNTEGFQSQVLGRIANPLVTKVATCVRIAHLPPVVEMAERLGTGLQIRLTRVQIPLSTPPTVGWPSGKAPVLKTEILREPGCVGSIPTPTAKTAGRCVMATHLASNQASGVRFSRPAPLCPVSAVGQRVSFRNSRSQVRILYGMPCPVSSGDLERQATNLEVGGSNPSQGTNESLAQLEEQPAFNRQVDGSTPSGLTIVGLLAQLVERLSYKEDVGGSIPSEPTIRVLSSMGEHLPCKQGDAGSSPVGSTTSRSPVSSVDVEQRASTSQVAGSNPAPGATITRTVRRRTNALLAERLKAPGCRPGSPLGTRWFESITTHHRHRRT